MERLDNEIDGEAQLAGLKDQLALGLEEVQKEAGGSASTCAHSLFDELQRKLRRHYSTLGPKTPVLPVVPRGQQTLLVPNRQLGGQGGVGTSISNSSRNS